MKNWLIPAIVLLAIAGAGMGVGWSVNEWQDGGQSAPVQTAPLQSGPSQAELDAQRCAAALQAAGQFSTSERGAFIAKNAGYPEEIQHALDSYCH